MRAALGALARLRRQEEGAVLLLGFCFISLVLMTILPGLYGIGQAVNAQARLTLAAQSAAYAAASALNDPNQVGGLQINEEAARGRAEAVLQSNLFDAPGQGLQLGGEEVRASSVSCQLWASDPDLSNGTTTDCAVRVFNIEATISESQAADADCASALAVSAEEPLYCWRDEEVGAYHRSSGVSVTLAAPVEICGTWSPQLIAEGEAGCWTMRLEGRGYAEYSTQQVKGSDLLFYVEDANSTANSRIVIRWQLRNGSLQEGQPVRCVLVTPSGRRLGADCPQQPGSEGQELTLNGQTCAAASGDEYLRVCYALTEYGTYSFYVEGKREDGATVRSAPVRYFDRVRPLEVRMGEVTGQSKDGKSGYLLSWGLRGSLATVVASQPANIHCELTVSVTANGKSYESTGAVLSGSACFNTAAGTDASGWPSYQQWLAVQQIGVPDANDPKKTVLLNAGSYRLRIWATYSGGTQTAASEKLWLADLSGSRLWSAKIIDAATPTADAPSSARFVWQLEDNWLSYALDAASSCKLEQGRGSDGNGNGKIDAGEWSWSSVAEAPCSIDEASATCTRATNGNCKLWESRFRYDFDASGQVKYRFTISLCPAGEPGSCSTASYSWLPQKYYLRYWYTRDTKTATATMSWQLLYGNKQTPTATVTVLPDTECALYQNGIRIARKTGTACMDSPRDPKKGYVWSWSKLSTQGTMVTVDAHLQVGSGDFQVGFFWRF